MSCRATLLVAALVLALAACTAAPAGDPTPTPATPTPEPASPAPPTPASTRASALIPVTVSFDGVTCTYAGPTVIPLGSVLEWTFTTTAATAEERSSWELIAFDVKPGTSFDEIVTWAAENELAQEPPFSWPPWSIDGLGMTVEELVPGAPMRTPVDSYPVLASCGIKEPDGEQVYPAMLIEVMKG
jgi:hypothetical protein